MAGALLANHEKLNPPTPPVIDSDFPTSAPTARQLGRDVPIARRPRTASLLGTASVAAAGLLAGPVLASSQVRGDAAAYPSPAGIEERCVMLARLPGGVYRDEDTVQERALCAIDVHDRAHAICPKTFSTSPGASIYVLAGARFDGNPAGFEREMCPHGKGMPHDAYASWVAVKM
ncbi:MAG: hypothetical protein MUF16_07360, partial [Burkholderiaceae bacterium]|nr:hypothetical protein [Burkholderiaceae bacterium]